MNLLINEVIKQLLALLRGGFLSSLQRSEIWLFSSIDHLLVNGAASSLTQGWFYQFFQKMELLSLALVLPMLLIGLCSAVISGSGGSLVRLVLLYLPIALVGSGVVLFAFEATSKIVDYMSEWIINSQNLSVASLAHMVSGIGMGGNPTNPMPFILIVIAGVGSIVASLSLYFELLIREGIVLVMAAFIPLILLGLILSSSRAIAFRFIEMSIGVIFSKLVIVVFLSLGMQMAVHSTSIGRSGQFLIALGIIAMSCFSPFLLMALLPFGHLSHQQQISQTGRGKAKQIGRLGALVVGPSSPEVGYPALPVAKATEVPSYLRQSGASGG